MQINRNIIASIACLQLIQLVRGFQTACVVSYRLYHCGFDKKTVIECPQFRKHFYDELKCREKAGDSRGCREFIDSCTYEPDLFEEICVKLGGIMKFDEPIFESGICERSKYYV